ncbi:MAG: hypothetical protein EOL93_01860, partial [Epsilonproteobacteria bacterium]|nr:hypothetical protein [Campylobacterota bacterium]
LTFSKILYFGQEDIKSFAGLSDAELKAVFEESLALTVLSDTELIFKNEVNAVSGKLSIVSRELERLKIEEKSSADIVETIKCSIGSYEEMRNKNLDSILGAISLTKKDHDDYVSNADKRRVDLQSKVYDFDDKSEKYIQISDLDSQLDFELKKNNSNQTSIGNEINSLKRNILVLESKIKSASELIGKPCETCSRPYRAEDIDPTVAIYKSNKDKAECDLETLILMLSGAVAKEKSLSESKLKIKEALSSLLKMKHEAEIANSELLKMDDEEVIGSFMNRIEEYQAQYHRVQTTINPYIKQFETSLASLSEIRENIDASLKQLEELTCMVDDLKLLQSAFGNSGIKNRVFDTITPELNKIISEYMAIVDDINVEVSTMKILKSGSIREKFEIVVENTHGASSYKGNSGGEKQKIDLCISLAFNSLMRRMIKNPINILFLDEPFEALDAGSAEAAVELCGLVAKDTNVFIVTHNQAIKDMVSNRIVVEKKSGLAKLLEE